MLELHCHTTCSDGSLSPSQLVEAATRAGVQALAISDHDTLAGWDEAVEAGCRFGVEIVPAVELSTVWQGRSLHLLGFYPRREQLTPLLEERRQGRIRRAEAMVQRLTELGYPIPMPDTHIAPGRPHLAQALVRAGHVRNTREAFERFLGDNGPAFVPYEKFSALEGIQLLRSCGAVPVWAHPGLFRGDTLENTFLVLLGAGLMGLEVYHPDHSLRQKRQLLRLAQKYSLVVTGGSDYHGPNQAGFHLNMMGLSLDLLHALKTAHSHVSA